MLRAWLVVLVLVMAGSAHAGPVTGSAIFEVRDSERTDPVSGGPRAWAVELFYPAQRPESAAPEPYFPDAGLAAALAEAGYYGVPADRIRGWADETGPAYSGAPARPGARALILLLPGQGVARRNYAGLAATFAARGYAVAIADLPYLGVSRTPDGRVLRPDDIPVLAAGDPADMTAYIAGWTADLSATLNFLETAPESAAWPAGLTLDRARIAAVGHSLGGAVSLDACGADERIRVCVDLEGAPFGTRAIERGAGGPTLAVLSRAADKPASLWTGIPADLAKWLGQSGAPVWIATVSGGGHMSFSDAPDRMPETLTRFGGDLMDAARSQTVYVSLVSGFLDAYFSSPAEPEAFAETVDSLPEAAASPARTILRNAAEAEKAP